MKVEFDPEVALPTIDADTRRAAEALVAVAPSVRIQAVSLAGQRAWLKRAQRRPMPGLFRALMVRGGLEAARWLTLPEGGAEPIAREARRLVWLGSQGVPVPALLAHGPGWMVLEDRGVSARALMPGLEHDARTALLEGILDDLIGVHGMGVWRGGGQIKNTIVLDGRRTLIDFEDGFGADADLCDLQARDLFLFLGSCVDWVPAAALAALVERYARRPGGGAVVARARSASALADAAWIRWIPGGDVRRARAACRALRAVN